MKYFTPLLLFLPPILLCLWVAPLRDFVLINAALQLTLFVFVVHLPAYRTGRMSYVDIGWPLGLAVIGALVFLLGSGDPARLALVGGIYLFMGLRMGVMALFYLYRGAFAKELPRYRFQRIRWGKEGKKNEMLAMQVDILLQALANVSFLSLPALFMAFAPEGPLHWIEIAGAALWVFSFGMETVADRQKQAFIKDAAARGDLRAVCNVGLWRYTRHPNYFFEWMVWNALIVMSLPAFVWMFPATHWSVWGALGVSLVFISRLMYNTLVLFTGAIPSEYYSRKKRPGYKEYRRVTNMFFPGPVRG